MAGRGRSTVDVQRAQLVSFSRDNGELREKVEKLTEKNRLLRLQLEASNLRKTRHAYIAAQARYRRAAAREQKLKEEVARLMNLIKAVHALSDLPPTKNRRNT